MRRQLNATKSRGGDVFVPMISINYLPMAIIGGLPMTMKGSAEDAD